MLIRISEWADNRLGDYLVYFTAAIAACAIVLTAYFTSGTKQ